MMKSVRVGHKDFTKYRDIIGYLQYGEIKKLAKQFKKARMLHINATAHGGGVAQILNSFVPIQRDLGIDSYWKTIEPKNNDFFVATKRIHNSLQGASYGLTKKQWQLWETENQGFAANFKPDKWDYIIVHDPQPAALLHYCEKGNAKWVWRCHIDLSQPNKDTATHLVPFLNPYDGTIFTLKHYVLKSLTKPKKVIIPVAIDPLTTKNRLLQHDEARMFVSGYGVDCDRPMMVQISRFDPWKDPLGVLEAWQIARQKVDGLQLVLMGDAATDDPEGGDVLRQVMQKIKGQDDVYIITDTNDEAVNAFQTIANVILQKSIREGFGLTVTEALWAKTPVVGGNVGGIPEQIKHGKSGYLVKSPKEAAKYVVELIQNPVKAEAMGLWGHEYVREHFLMPLMIKRHLEFLLKI